MQTDPVIAAKQRVLKTFRWVDGHADVDGLFRDAQLVELLGEALAGPFRDEGITIACAVEAVGFVPATLVARSLGVGVVLLRKHPRPGGAVIAETTGPDWRGRTATFSVHVGHLRASDRVLIVDEWVETGSHAMAAWRLIEQCGATPVGTAAVIDDVRNAEVRASLRLCGLLRADELPVPDSSA
jgi:adenine phosphoribosyltransferase